MKTKIRLSSLISRKWVKQIYTGREEGCRCGCHGKYFNDGAGFTRALNRAFKFDPMVTVCEDNADVNTEAVAVRRFVAATAQPTAYAHAPDGVTVKWIDIVLDGTYPHLNTITLYPNV